MLRKFIIMAVVTLMAVPAMGQALECQTICNPKQGDFQIGIVTGQSNFFTGNHSFYLLPDDDTRYGVIEDVGISTDQMQSYFNLGSLGTNSMINMIGIKASYFIFDRWEINGMFGMNMDLTPKKDFVEGDFSVPDMPIPQYNYVEGETNHLFYAEVGSNYRFKMNNPKISPYVGVFGGFQMARVEAMHPYTGETNSEGDDIELFRASYRAGQAYAIRSGIMAGIDYLLSPGLIIGIEIAPAAYQYSVVDIRPQGFENFTAANHSIKIFSQPRLKFGFRF